MPSYIGSECPVCGKAFTQQDDIVVCPECGSPHHRACYKAQGHCGNQEYHQAGKQWQPEPPPAYQNEHTTQDVVVCRSCGEHNPAANIFCQRCGQKILGTPQGSPPDHGYPYAPQYGAKPGAPGDPRQEGPTPAFFGAQTDYSQELEQGVTLGEAADYVGPNSLPFLMRFQAIAKGALSFNWSAFFFGYFYCFYRKMNRTGIVLLSIFLAMLLPFCYFAVLVVQESLAATGGVLTLPMELNMNTAAYTNLLLVLSGMRLISFGCMMYCGFTFNKSYYRRMIGQIVAQRQQGTVTPGTPEYRGAVSRLGGVNQAAPFVAAGVVVTVYFALAYAMTFFMMQ